MSRRSPLPDSSRRHHNSEGDRYPGRRGDPDGYRSSVDRESRWDDRRDRRAPPERDTRRDYRDDRRRRDDEDDGRRKADDFYGRDGERRRRDGSRDDRYASRHDNDNENENDNDRDRSRRKDFRDRGGRLRDDRDRRDPNRERGGSSRRSASPQRSRPPSHSTSAPPEDKAKPNFTPSGLLAAATNTVKNVDGTSTLLKYNEPPEARKPLVGWRLYVFKGEEQVGACPLPTPLSSPAMLPTFIPRVGLYRSAPYTTAKCVPRRS